MFEAIPVSEVKVGDVIRVLGMVYPTYIEAEVFEVEHRRGLVFLNGVAFGKDTYASVKVSQ